MAAITRNKVLVFCVAGLVNLLASGLGAEDMVSLRLREVEIVCDPLLKSAADEVIELYPEVKRKLEVLFGWDLSGRPSIVITKNRRFFEQMRQKPIMVAFAVPSKNLIVIDYAKVKLQPFSLESTLKHELCHLLLHHHIDRKRLPKWMNEGICQWVSDGIGEFFLDRKRSVLKKAAFAGELIPFRALERAFPPDEEALILAYEQSKSFLDYIIAIYGKESLLDVLARMRNGEDADTAMMQVFSERRETLEIAWRHSLKEKVRWFAHFSYHLYGILFGIMALIAVYGFVRQIRKKRAYEDDGTEDVTDH
jgi:hypothetical protein